MIKADKYYKRNLSDIQLNGCIDEDPRPRWKDGAPAHTKFISQVWEKYDINAGEFPIPTLRNTAIKTGIKEMFWIYNKQSSSLQEARDLGINWWEEWNIGDGTIGQRYGATVKKYDIVNNVLNTLEKDPFGRRHIINLYQEADLIETKGLNPCAYESIFTVRKINGIMYLDMTLVQRSNDYITAGYINKSQYVANQMMFAAHLGFEVGNFAHLTQNLHIYDRHMPAIDILLNTEHLDIQPKLILHNKDKKFYDFTIDDFEVTGIKDIPKLPFTLEIAI